MTETTTVPANGAKLLDAMTLPLQGTQLIEASAGTGKTYTISGLYLRLLLGVGVAQPLSCEQILVVTFTNAATEELRERIRGRIRQAYRACLGLPEQDPFLHTLLQSIPTEQLPQALSRLDLALKSLDEAAIFTIHSFCQRVLSDLAFESALLFEAEFTLDDSEFLHHAIRDFWRAYCYPLSELLAQIIHDALPGPDALQQKLRPLLGNSLAVPQPKTATFTVLADRLAEALAQLRRRWPVERDNLQQLLYSLSLNGRRYGKKEDGYPLLAAAMAQLDHWSSTAIALPPGAALDKLSLDNLSVNKGSVAPSPEAVPVLVLVDKIAALKEQLLPAFLGLARDEIRQRFAAEKAKHHLLTPDDLLATLASALGYPANVSAAPAAETHPGAAQAIEAPPTDTQTPIPAPEDAAATFEPHSVQQLVQTLRRRYPVALIDEFQDTDPLQFAIFSRIYGATPSFARTEKSEPPPPAASSGLLMIGDPKQAIYAFRGGDIHTYLAAKNHAHGQYTLTTNYRSAAAMVSGVNQLFAGHSTPFIEQNIPFTIAQVPANAAQKHLQSPGDNHALQLRLLSEDPSNGLTKESARQWLAEDAAEQILALLNGAAAIVDGRSGDEHRTLLRAKDIAVLVRDHVEASLMKQALSKRQIGAVFLSRDSVFATLEARELVLLLQALANPRDETALRAAMATQLLGLSIGAIHEFNQSEDSRTLWLERFERWHHLWLSRGIMPALMQLASDTGIIHRCLAGADGERRLTDWRHLCELLQQKSAELDGHGALRYWFEQQLLEAANGEEQQLRLESEQNLVQIVTIHKSKGLEYPVCLLPFISLAGNQRSPDPLLYHQDQQLVWDLLRSEDGKAQQRQEQLAEDLRLLYVALTRPIFRCYLSIANHSSMLKSGIKSHLPLTAIGYLLGIRDSATDFAALCQVVETQRSAAISIAVMPAPASGLLQQQQTASATVTPLPLSITAAEPWRVGSYSGLIKSSDQHLHKEANAPQQSSADIAPPQQPGMDDDNFANRLDSQPSVETMANFYQSAEVDAQSEREAPADFSRQPDVDTAPAARFLFEKGPNAGSFMHQVLEQLEFGNDDLAGAVAASLPSAMLQYGIDSQQFAMLQQWYLEILTTPLGNGERDASLTLAALSAPQLLAEMEFYLPVTQLSYQRLNPLLAQYGYPANFSFDTLRGMLKGFIDLTFCYQGRWYIADYKSNHLGNHFSDYHGPALQQAMTEHHYQLQYLLYTLALHRLLQTRLPNYQYHQHIGGCYYLFLRGMSAAHPGAGIYYDKPPEALIMALDELFKGNITPLADPQGQYRLELN